MNGLAGTAVFVLSVTLSAALLFTVEPMVTKMLLPRFGGSAAVWSVAIVFFQGALLIGYLYAHALTRWLSPRRSALVQIGVMLAAALALPIAVGSGEAGSQPALGVLLALAVAVGAPFTALSANAPLLQAWFARSRLPGAHNPYPLYAASNIGSLAALLAYPFLIEPAANLSQQSWGWALGYGVLIVALSGAMLLTSAGALGSAPARVAADRRWPLWLLLALIPSAGLVAVTGHISADVAAAPFLWVLPLALYLTSFIFAFGSRAALWLGAARWLLPLALIAVAATQGLQMRFGLVPEVALHLATFFLIALVFHGLLAERRPAPEGLTSFYLAMSAGGLIGGIAAALVAPAVFSFIAEYPLLLIAAAFAVPWPGAVAAVVAALIVLPPILMPSAQEVITRRSFYGVHRMEVTRDGQFRLLKHGQEVHGAIRLRNADGTAVTGKPKPLTYYHEDGPISEAIDAAKAKRSGPIRAGVIGLGTGSMACLVDPGDAIDFYEIDPEVIRIARDETLFGFLSACLPAAQIIEGDARQMLARSAARYDMLIVDAFSSDAIPAHLLTREALASYMDRLAPGGLLILHISNDHLRLNEIVTATARSLGLKLRINDEYPADDAGPFIYQPTVAAIAREEADFGALKDSDEWLTPDERSTARPWSDDYSNLLAAIIAKARED